MGATMMVRTSSGLLHPLFPIFTKHGAARLPMKNNGVVSRKSDQSYHYDCSSIKRAIARCAAIFIAVFWFGPCPVPYF